ncbi:MAG: hypothetical protein ACLQGP_27550 [Isosphaeraceae bacterium]
MNRVVVLGLAVIGGGARAAGDGERSPDPDKNPGVESIRASVARALPLLVKAGAEEYPKHRDCFSCHNQAVPALALDLARRHGFAVEAETLQSIAEHTEADLNGAIEDYRAGKGQPGGVIRAGYALWALEAAGWERDQTTAAVAHYLSATQGRRDHWLAQSQRPPSESSDFTATALALRGLHAFRPRTASTSLKDKDPKGTVESTLPEAQRCAQALKWLLQTRPRETEDRVFRLWGLKYAGADAKDLEAAVADLIRTQRPDGGWSQLDAAVPAGPSANPKDQGRLPVGASSSDAYATGSTLVALHLAGGVSTDLPAYRRGLAFLIKTQRDDGSWFIKSRSKPFQPYFESGFPHGPDQFISVAATGWAVAAMSLACPSP